MKVLSVTRIVYELVGTDEGEQKTYRRNSANNWERLIGQSEVLGVTRTTWESVNNSKCENLEEVYQKADY